VMGDGDELCGGGSVGGGCLWLGSTERRLHCNQVPRSHGLVSVRVSRRRAPAYRETLEAGG
jgi:hypothetical protein